MSRYPYTDACDFVRSHVTEFSSDFVGPVPSISRSQASQAMAAFEKVFNLTHEEMAKKLADYAKETA